ncbi:MULTISPECIES: glycosyltransferase family 4 protein [Psychrilyobacter]|uniref:Glycosyltransferase n=1 Tax=Psychrilyobacter piezotolerans TaxID=2293438 RepID=A0ABX9KDS7_9FUSO|nr:MULTISPECIES: glycosyltransferase family 4 protein [Psychrilyobacter]MCS5422117.1 glycosyltransferase family 4 protein [Psychrilyobacter sp. S5]NDI76286.1 glycosyltransferase family 4 protein [Psychrilyobacter piezotolerans]RDE59171.1 glycosyltransferase family 1 protein [Psychrilyobacter sp. S5]REI39733.1 glycosyltransferase [Psychrilyobacter piezotolerans]
MKIIVISPKNKTLFNFRGDLIKEMVAKGHEVVALGPNKDFMEDILKLGIKFREVPFSKDNTSIKGDFQYYLNLKKVIKEEKPELVFSYNIKPVIYSSLAAYHSGVRKIYPMIAGAGRIYGSDSLKIKMIRSITGVLYKTAFKCCNKVIFQNTDDLEEFVGRKYLAKSKTVHVNGSGVNMERFKAVKLPEEPIFLMISRIIKEKGIFEYLEAAKKVKKEYPEARFILLGGYDTSLGAIQPEELQPYIDKGIIEFPGEVKNVVPILESARVFVLPTYYREGLPRTILESMSMGKPIITTDWNGCRDAVKDKVNGFLVNPKCSRELAEKMKDMLNNPKKTLEMGHKSLEICSEKYDVNIVNKHMLEIMGIQ